MLIVFEGIDGSGKTTIAQELQRTIVSKCPSVKSCFYKKNGITSSDAFVNKQITLLRELIWPPENEEPESDPLGAHCYLFLLSAWMSLLQNVLLRDLSNDEVFIMDGWYYKIIAKAYTRGIVDMSWLNSLFEHIKKPDIIFLVDCEPEIAWKRRNFFKPSELGSWDGYSSNKRKMFCSYQKIIRLELLNMLESNSTYLIKNTEYSSLETITSECLSLVINKLNNRI